MSGYDDDYTPTVTGHETEHGFAFTVEVLPPNPDDIAEALARRMVAEYSVGDKLRKAVSDRVSELIRELVDAEATRVITEQLILPRQPTDTFGTPVGEPKSFAQLIGEQVKAWQEETVDPHTGVVKKKDSYNSVITRAQWLVRQAGAAEFAKEAKEAVQAVRNDAKANITFAIKNAVGDALAGILK